RLRRRLSSSPRTMRSERGTSARRLERSIICASPSIPPHCSRRCATGWEAPPSDPARHIRLPLPPAGSNRSCYQGLWAMRLQRAKPRITMERDSGRAFLLPSTILDSLIEEVAIIDRDGRIVHANAAWKECARFLGGGDASAAEDTDYARALRNAADSSPDAARLLAGIESVLAGSTDFFEH